VKVGTVGGDADGNVVCLALDDLAEYHEVRLERKLLVVFVAMLPQPTEPAQSVGGGHATG
jgi:hypothetical protein